MKQHDIKKTTGITAIACLAIFTVVAAVSCRKEKADRVDAKPTLGFNLQEVKKCHQQQNQAPSQITSRLEGTWSWLSFTCHWSLDSTFTADKHVVVTFSDAGVYKVFENSTIESEGTWKLSQTTDNNWTIVTERPSEYLNGYIWLCNDEVIFHNSYLDGCDYYFVRE